MKNKSLLIILALALFTAATMAQMRTAGEAMALAQAFFPGKTESIQLAYTAKSKLRAGADKTYFYAFNHGEGKGYVLVSADARAKEVLGYAAEGTFDFANLPQNFKYWLASYEAEIESLGQPLAKAPSPAPPQPRPAMASAAALETVVRPLLQTKWGQEEPYNNLCPVIGKAAAATGTHAAAGCVATVMAQIMKYYEWPVQGTGAHAYTLAATGEELAANFAATVYDWPAMANKYTGKESEAAQKAVATLAYHCGVAVEMDYSTDGSGAYDSDVPTALQAYFGYDSGMNIYFRDYYTQAEWTQFIKTELSAKRPVYYSGSTGNGGFGHAFVCDGYNAEGFFHFNWGWKGYADGYFALSALNPNSPGVGGGWEGYNYLQSIITGIQPATGANPPSPRLGFASITSSKATLASLTEKFNITLAEVLNRGNKTFQGSIGLAVCRADSALVHFTKIYETGASGLAPYWGYEELPIEDYSLPRTLPAGVYKIIPAYADISGTAILMEGAAGQIHSLTATVSPTGQVALTPTAPAAPLLELKRFEPLATFYEGSAGQFTAVIQNTGNGDYNAGLLITFAGTEIREPVVIFPGELKVTGFTHTITAPPGLYTATLYYSDRGAWAALDSIPVAVNPPPAAPAALTCLSASFPGGPGVDKESPKFTAVIQNTGGFYEGGFVALVFPARGGSNIADFGYQPAIVDANQTKTLLFNTPIDLPGGQYLAAVFYYKNGDWAQLSQAVSFTLSSPVAAAPSPVASLRLSTAGSILSLESNILVEKIAIYDMGGRLQARLSPNSSGPITIPIHQFPPAPYLLHVQTPGKTQTLKFLKK